MQYANSDLENLVPLWQRELPYRANQPVRDGLLRSDVNVFGAPVGEYGVGDVGTLAQDAFRSRLISQGAVKGTLK